MVSLRRANKLYVTYEYIEIILPRVICKCHQVSRFAERIGNSVWQMGAEQAVPLREKMDALDELHGLSTTETTFLLESLQQVVECRRVLKWTYVRASVPRIFAGV